MEKYFVVRRSEYHLVNRETKEVKPVMVDFSVIDNDSKDEKLSLTLQKIGHGENGPLAIKDADVFSLLTYTKKKLSQGQDNEELGPVVTILERSVGNEQ